MASYDPNQLFNFAKEKYSYCEALISEMVGIVKSVVPEYELEASMIDFDVTIQCCMLQAAMKDLSFAKNEKIFINNITKYGDLLGLLNYEFKKSMPTWNDIGWDNLADLTDDNKAAFAALAIQVVTPIARTFAEIMALVDKIVKEKDYMKLLYTAVGEMFIALTGIDGDDVDSAKADSESGIAYNTYYSLVNDPWKAELNS